MLLTVPCICVLNVVYISLKSQLAQNFHYFPDYLVSWSGGYVASFVMAGGVMLASGVMMLTSGGVHIYQKVKLQTKLNARLGGDYTAVPVGEKVVNGHAEIQNASSV